MIKVVWHYATIASIEIFHNKREIGQHKFRLIRHNEKSCFKTTLCENETIKYYLISNSLNQNFAHGYSVYMFGGYRNRQSLGSRPLQKF